MESYQPRLDTPPSGLKPFLENLEPWVKKPTSLLVHHYSFSIDGCWNINRKVSSTHTCGFKACSFVFFIAGVRVTVRNLLPAVVVGIILRPILITVCIDNSRVFHWQRNWIVSFTKRGPRDLLTNHISAHTFISAGLIQNLSASLNWSCRPSVSLLDQNCRTTWITVPVVWQFTVTGAPCNVLVVALSSTSLC